MRHVCVSFAAVLLLMIPAAPAPADDARALIERAVRAHGGIDKLAQLKQYRERTRGTIFPGEGKRTFTMQVTIRLPDQFRAELTSDLGTARLELIQVFDGAKGWVSDNGRTSEVRPEILADYQDLIHLQRASALTPLVQDDSYTLTRLDEIKVQDRPALGVQVARKGRRDLKLYFDKESLLLVKREYKSRETGKESLREEYLSGYKALEGVQRAHKFLIHHDGKKFAEAELIEWKPLRRVDDSEFARP